MRRLSTTLFVIRDANARNSGIYSRFEMSNVECMAKEKNIVENDQFEIIFGKDEKLKARLAIISYEERTAPERYLGEETNGRYCGMGR